jgi:hypothetical protein
MTPHQTLAVAVRLFAIWLALAVIRESLGSYMGLRDKQETLLPIFAVVGTVTLVFVLILWFFPKSIARGLLSSRSDVPVQPSAAETWFSMGVSLIGLWLVASAIPGVLRNLLVTYLYASDGMLDKSGLVAGLIYLFAQVAVGALLIVGANGIRRFIWWARHAGPD